MVVHVGRMHAGMRVLNKVTCAASTWLGVTILVLCGEMYQDGHDPCQIRARHRGQVFGASGNSSHTFAE